MEEDDKGDRGDPRVALAWIGAVTAMVTAIGTAINIGSVPGIVAGIAVLGLTVAVLLIV